MIRKPGTFQTYDIQALSDFITERLSWLDYSDFLNLQCSDNGEDEAIEIVNANIDLAESLMEAQQAWHGASKCVFRFNEYPKVVFKIPFKGEGRFFFDEELDEYIYDTSDIVEWFEGASLASEHWDYCEQEQEVYKLAEKANLSCFLAETFKLCTYCGYPIYVSQYAKDVDNIKECSEDSKKAAKKYIEEKHDYNFSSLVLGNFLDRYSSEAVYRLLSFFWVYGLSDFHCGNLGYDCDGKIIIIDYSDFCS